MMTDKEKFKLLRDFVYEMWAKQVEIGMMRKTAVDTSNWGMLFKK